jgi:hypothetical protein
MRPESEPALLSRLPRNDPEAADSTRRATDSREPSPGPSADNRRGRSPAHRVAERAHRVEGKGPRAQEALALDGKTLRGSYDRGRGRTGNCSTSRGQQQLSGVDLATGAALVQVGFSGKKEDAEGPALR